jgi:zinc protease
MLVIVVLVAGLVFPLSNGAAQSAGKIPRDPALVQGTLANGFQYLLMKNTTPKDRVSVHLNVFTGSVHERDDEQGIAHFLEHMLFNGSEHFKPGELITYFQSIGMDFGADANARTSFFSTIYDLSLPKGDEKHLKDAFVVIKDYAGGALLLESEVDRERGVVLAEKRERDSVSFRTFKKELAFELPGSLLAERLPIGTAQVLEKADRELLKGFYDNWYRPDNLALVIVGDMDIDLTQSLIRKTFSTLKSRSAEPMVGPDISWTPHQGTKVFYHYEPEAGNTDVTIERITHEDFKPETVDRLKEKSTQYIGDLIFQNRLSRMVREQTADFSSASVYSGTYLKNLTIAAVQASCDPENWESSLGQLETALRQALEHGFLPRELDRVKADVLSSLDADVAGATTRKSNAVARELLNALNRKELFLSPEQNRDILSPHISALTLKQVNAAFKASWPMDQRLVLVSGNAAIKTDPETRIAQIFQKSSAVSVSPYHLAEAKAFPYLKLSEKKGSIVVSRENVKNLGIRQVDFSNHVRLNLKPTDFKKGEFAFKAVFGTGRAGIPESLYGVSQLIQSAVGQSGFGAMDMDEIDMALAGKEMDYSFKIDDTYFSIEGTAPPEEAELVFQLLYTYFNDPGFKEKSLDLAKVKYRQRYDELKRTPDGIMQIKGSRFLAEGDPRFGLTPPDLINGISMDKIASWLRPAFDSAPLEVSFAGDFDTEKLVELGQTYMGGMSDRMKPSKTLPLKEGVGFPKGRTQVYELDTKLDKGMIRVSFLTDDFWDIMQTRKLSVLSRVFSERLRITIREALGASYSPYVYNKPSLIYEGYGVMNAVVNLSPKSVDMVVEQINALIEDLAANGVTPKELELVKAPLLNHLAVLRQNNGYWLNSVMSNSFRYPERLDWANHLVSGYSEITARQLSDLAKQYLLIKERALIIIRPAPAD